MGARGAGVLPYKRLMGMCRWMGRIFTTGLTIMGSHFQRVTRMGSHIFCSFGVRRFFIFTVSKRTRMFTVGEK